MQIISHKQIATLEAYMSEQFIQRLLRFLRDKCDLSNPYEAGAAEKNKLELEPRTRNLVKRAKELGMESELAIANIAIIGLCYSFNFDQLASVQTMFANIGRSPDQNMGIVMERLVIAERNKHVR